MQTVILKRHIIAQIISRATVRPGQFFQEIPGVGVKLLKCHILKRHDLSQERVKPDKHAERVHEIIFIFVFPDCLEPNDSHVDQSVQLTVLTFIVQIFIPKEHRTKFFDIRREYDFE